MTPVERVARAIYAENLFGMPNPDWDAWPMTEAKKACVRTARAAIEALREPSEKMVDAADVYGFGEGYLSPESTWERMISAALSEGE
jgi:hypothetical protein